MELNVLYESFQGEVNRFGIGSPTLFLRLQGCHIRCYKRTLGHLCDTPESLKKPIGKTEISSIFVRVEKLSKKTGIKVVTLTGGDPLWNSKEEVETLLKWLTDRGFYVSIETSGTLSWVPFVNISNNISWVIDYKLKSAGIKNGLEFFSDEEHLNVLTENDFIKFVVYDEEDYEEMVKAVYTLQDKTKAKLAVGSYWGGKIPTIGLFQKLSQDKLLGKVVMNMQTHKMAFSSDYSKRIPIKL